jgi:hypothetical protein
MATSVARPATLCALILAGCSVNRSSFRMPGTGVQTPFELVDNMPVVRARLGRGTDIAALIDTGANGFCITPETATRAHLAQASRVQELEGVDGKMSRHIMSSHRARVTIGELVLEHLEAFVIPELGALSADVGRPIDALIGGARLLGPVLVSLDYPARQLRLEQGSLPAPNGRDVIAGNFDDGRPRVSIAVAGVVVTALLDSGCDGTFDLPLALSKTLPLRAEPHNGRQHSGINGDGVSHYARLNGTIRIGGYSIVDPEINFSGTEPSVCGKVLREFAVTLDPAHRRVRFARSNLDPIAVPSHRTLGLGLSKREGKWVVVTLEPGRAPPEAALGDEIVSYNGSARAELTRDNLAALLGHVDTVHVVLRRAGRLIELDAPVYDEY